MALTQEQVNDLHEQATYSKRFGNGQMTVSADVLHSLLPPKSLLVAVPDQGDTISQATASVPEGEPAPTAVVPDPTTVQ